MAILSEDNSVYIRGSERGARRGTVSVRKAPQRFKTNTKTSEQLGIIEVKSDSLLDGDF